MADEDGMYPDPEESGERAEQTVTLEDIGPARKCLTIEIPETRITAKLAEQYKQLRDDAAIPGFRRGRAPKRLIEKRFGQAVRDDARGQLISESYTQAIEEEKLEVLGEPDVKDIDDIELPDAGEMTFKVEVEVAPDVELPDLSKLKVEKAERQATDDDVQEEIDNLSRRHGKPVQVDEAIAAQDMLVAQVKILAGDDPAHDAEPLNFLPDAHITVNGESADFRGHAAGILIDDLGKRLIRYATSRSRLKSRWKKSNGSNQRPSKNWPGTLDLHRIRNFATCSKTCLTSDSNVSRRRRCTNRYPTS